MEFIVLLTGPTNVLSIAAVSSSAGISVAVLCLLLFVLPMEAAVATAFLAFAMTLITTADLRHFIIPDLLTLPAIPAGIVSNVLVFHGDDWWVGLAESLTGASAGASVFLLLRLCYQRARGVEGMGLGDVKLAAVAGAWLGPEALAWACLLAALGALSAVILRAALKGGARIHARSIIPFGAFIAPVIFIWWIWRLLPAILL